MKYKIKKVTITLKKHPTSPDIYLGEDIDDAFLEGGMFIIKRPDEDIIYPLEVIERVKINKS